MDAVSKERGRLVEFNEGYDYMQGAQRGCLYLSYFKSINNIYDLEFFCNKLASAAHTISDVEKKVLSGVPFWEEGEDAMFESDEEEGDVGQSVDNDRFDEGGHKPLKNVLAGKVSDKVAD